MSELIIHRIDESQSGTLYFDFSFESNETEDTCQGNDDLPHQNQKMLEPEAEKKS
jgi:hypothetical protein